MKLGINHDWGIGPQTATFNDYQLIQRGGITMLRYLLYWNRVNPRPGVYDFSQVDYELGLAWDSGFEVYINIMWAPRWVSNDVPIYEPFHPLCTTATIQADNSIGVIYDENKAKVCKTPPKISPGAIYGIVDRTLSRYQHRGLKYLGFWNEPCYRVFWPPISWDRYINEIVVPFTDAVRTYQTIPIQIVGPETAEISSMMVLLEEERRRKARFWDILSYHAYSPNTFPDGAIAKINTIEEIDDPREKWCTEVSTDPTNADEAGLAKHKTDMDSFLEKAPDGTYFIYRMKRDSHFADHGLILPDGKPTPFLQNRIPENLRYLSE